MKKNLLIMLTVLLASTVAIGQAPGIFNYQGVARNSVGNVLVNKSITLRLTIHDGTAAGPTVYQESRTVVTNPFGLFNAQVGSAGGSAVTGTIAGVPWGVGAKFIQVEIDPNGGTSFINIGTAQIASVPYALFATSAGDLVLPYNKTQADAGTLFKITNSGTNAGSTALEGLTNSQAGNANAIIGTVTSASPGGFSAGVRGINNGTGGLGIGVYGSQAGAGWGVYGTAPNGIGVHGNSATGFGVVGLSNTGTAVSGNSSTGVAGIFENTNNASTSNALVANNNGSGSSIIATNTGTGRAGTFVVNNAASTADAVNATTNGTGASWAIRGTSSGTNGAGLFIQTNAANTSNNLQSNQAGLGRAGLFNATNAASTANTVEINTAGSGAGVLSTVTGTGSAAGVFNKTNAANTQNTVLVVDADVTTTAATNAAILAAKGPLASTVLTGPTAIKGFGATATGIGISGGTSSGFGVAGVATTGIGVVALTTTTGSSLVSQNVGTGGLAGDFLLNVNTNVNNAVRVINNNNAAGSASSVNGGGNTIFARKGAGLGASYPSPAGVYGSSELATGIGVIGATNTGVGVQGGAIQAGGTGVLGRADNAAGTAVGLFGFAGVPTSFALVTSGAVQIQGQGAGLNKVLTSDAIGNATWQSLGAIGGGVGGSGTLNFVPKWTPDGATLGNSQIFDNGTSVGVNTPAPTSRVHVTDNGTGFSRNISLVASSTLTGIRITPTAVNNSAGLSITDATGAIQNAQIYFLSSAASPLNNNLIVSTDNLGNTLDITVKKGTGNVGIGKGNSVAKLELGALSQANNTYTIASGFTGVTGIASSDATAATGSKFGVYGFADGSTGDAQYSVFGEAGTTSPVRNAGVTGRVSFAPTGAGPSSAIRALDGVGNANTWALSIAGRMQYQDGTQGAGKILTSDASGNASWQDAPAKVSMRASVISSTPVPTSTFVNIIYTTVNFEEGGLNYDPTTGIYTVPSTGLYSITGKFVWNTFTSATGTRNIAVLVNGVLRELSPEAPPTTGTFITSKVSSMLQLTTGDQIKIQAFQNSGAAASVQGFAGPEDNTFSIFRIH